MERINSCRVCGNVNIKEFFDLGNQPFANTLLNKKNQIENTYPLSLSWCSNCNLVQLNHTADPGELFNEYVWVTGTSSTAKKYAETFHQKIAEKTDLKGGYVVEVASNDGTFLKPFLDNNIEVLGIDPAKNIAEMAKKAGINTICEFFGEKTAKKLVLEKGKAKFVFARNVLPHVANLHDFVKGLHILLDDKGLLVIEFHYAKPILDDLHYDSIYHEHLCYYTLKSIERLLNIHNLYLSDIDVSPINAGNLILYIRKNKSQENVKVQEYRELEKQTNTFESWHKFAKRAKEHKNKLIEVLKHAKNNNKTVIGYGASARSSTMLNYCNIDDNLLPVIADMNPLKQNKYTAGTHILIADPETAMQKKPDYVLLLAWNFEDEITEYLKTNFNYNNKYIIPLPKLIVK